MAGSGGGRLVAGTLPDLLLRAAVGQAGPGRGGFLRAALAARWPSRVLSVARSASARPARSLASKAIAVSRRRANAASPASVSATTWTRRLAASRVLLDQPAGVHGVQVVRQRGLAHSYRLGEFPLVGGLASFRLSRISQTGRVPPLCQSLVERALYGAGRLAQAEPDRDGKRCWHVSQHITKHRHLTD